MTAGRASPVTVRRSDFSFFCVSVKSSHLGCSRCNFEALPDRSPLEKRVGLWIRHGHGSSNNLLLETASWSSFTGLIFWVGSVGK